jgi:hypothetical protein
VTQASCGGVTHWVLADDDTDGIMTIAFGQGAGNGMLLTRPVKAGKFTWRLQANLALGRTSPRVPRSQRIISHSLALESSSKLAPGVRLL